VGYNTTILILNDGLHELVKYPEQAIEGIWNKIASSKEGDVRVGNHANPIYVMKTAHADVPRLYFTHGNGITELSRWNGETMRMVANPGYLRDHVVSSIKRAESELRELKKAIKEQVDKEK
jgi:hypothetical protein